MDETEVRDAFDRLLEARPPLPPSLGRSELLSTGHRALRRRRAVRTGAGSAIVVAALTAGTATAPAILSARRSGGGPVAASEAPAHSTGPALRLTAPASPSPASAAKPALAEAESCRSNGASMLTPGKPVAGAPLPSPQSVAVAVRAAAPRFASGARVTFVRGVDMSALSKTGGSRVVVLFDVVDEAGAGGLSVEITPFRGMTAQQMADLVVKIRPYDNCTPANRRIEPDGSAGLVYPKPFGEYRRYPNKVAITASYFAASGVEVYATAVPWAYSVQGAKTQLYPDKDGFSPPATRPTLPLTPQQAYEFARLAGSLPTGR
jgi:hypothetical protein